MNEMKSEQTMYNKATGMYMKALAELMKALDAHTEVRAEMNGKLLKRALDDGFLCVLSNEIRQRLWNYCYDNEILLARGPFPSAKATLNCIGWVFPYHEVGDKQEVHRQLVEAEFIQHGGERRRFRKFWYHVLAAFRVRPIEIPPNIVKISLTNAFYQTAVEVLGTVNLDTQQIYQNVFYAVSPTHYAIPGNGKDSNRQKGKVDIEKIS
jgi:hypothetical protein